MKQYTSFTFQGEKLEVKFIETMQVVDGVECDVYEFVGDTTKDLGIIRISKNSQTPKQRVLKGDKTIEGYISGKGKLIIERNSELQEYRIVEDENLEVVVKIGEKMQWFADENSELIAYEICFPLYEDGRYEDL